MSSRQSFPNLDIAKFLMALLVVEIHTKPFNDFNSKTISQIVSGIDCVAVPFFFIASGFLCFRGLAACDFCSSASLGTVRLKETIRKQSLLYAIWTILLLPIALFGISLKDWGFEKAAWMLIRGILFVGNNVLTWPLWYLLASVVAFILIYVLLRKGMSAKMILIVSGMALLFGHVLQKAISWDDAPLAIAALTDLYSTIFGTTRNGLFEGFFYVAVGMVIGFSWNKRHATSPVWACIGLATGLVGCITISPDAHLPFCALFAISLFMLCIRRVDNTSHSWVRKASTVIYLVHMIFVVILVYGLYGHTEPSVSSAPISHIALYVFVVGCSLLVAAIVTPLGKRFPIVKTIFGV